MSEEPIEAWDPPARAEAGAVLAAALRREPARAHAIACGLAPDEGGKGIRYARYENTLVSAKTSVPYQLAFGDLAAFVEVLEAGEPGALELAVAIVAELDHEIVVAAARILLPHRAWRGLGTALARALGKSSSEASFGLLLDSPRAPYLRDGLRSNGFAGGVARAWAAYHAVGGLDAKGLTPEQRVDTEPVLGYLLCHDREHAFAELVRLVRSESEPSPFVVHALANLGTEEAHAVLFDELARAPGGTRLGFAPSHAIKLLLERDATTTIDALGGVAFLASPAGRPRLSALLHWLRDDTWRIKKGWLAADPRFVELCIGLKGDADRPLAALAKDMVATLPPELRPTPSRTRKASKVVVDPAVLRELESIRASLERLRTHLKATKYRFAHPRRVLAAPTAADAKALARLQKTVAVPPVLVALWQIVGAVDLRGHHPRWSRTSWLGFRGAKEPVWLTDPLVIAPAAHAIGEALEEHDEPPLPLHLAPDATGKAGYSGGQLTLWLPQDDPDPEFEGTAQTLLAHLRHALQWGGFPGFAAIDDRPEAWLTDARAACA